MGAYPGSSQNSWFQNRRKNINLHSDTSQQATERMTIIMTYAETAISDYWSRNMLRNKTTAVSLYNRRSPQPSDCTPQAPPHILGSSANLINSLARNAGIEFIPWRTCRQTDKNRYHYSCWMPRDTQYGHKRLLQAMPACPSGPGCEGYTLIPSQNHKAQVKKEEAWGL